MKRTAKTILCAVLALMLALACALPAGLVLAEGPAESNVPEGYNEHDYLKCLAFLETEDENGVKNGEKLSETYDPADPATWGVNEEYGDDWIGETPTAKWCEVDGELRLSEFFTTQWNGCGLVGELDFSDCTSLVRLVCSGNQLAGVDVSGCSALVVLLCSNDGLTELDVSGIGTLRTLYCAYNPLGSFDVSASPALWALDCRGLGLTELDLSANPELLQLYCSDNELATLDLTANPRCSELYCERNPMTLIEMSDRTIRAEGRGTIGYYTVTEHPLSDEWHYVVAYPDEGSAFLGWYDLDGELLSAESEFETVCGVSEYRARFTGWDDGMVPMGDADGDGSVTAADAVLVMRAAMGILEFTGTQAANADMDESGSITVADAIIVLRIAMGLI